MTDQEATSPGPNRRIEIDAEVRWTCTDCGGEMGHKPDCPRILATYKRDEEATKND